MVTAVAAAAVVAKNARLFIVTSLESLSTMIKTPNSPTGNSYSERGIIRSMLGL
jgi:hypothetical protein